MLLAQHMLCTVCVFHSGQALALSSSAAASACLKRMLNNKLRISCLVTAREVLKYLQIVLGQTIDMVFDNTLDFCLVLSKGPL